LKKINPNLKRQKVKKEPIVRREPRGKVEVAKATPTTKQPKYSQKDTRKKICLIQTGSWGDNINSTLMFGPIKNHFDDCVLDVHTSTYYVSAFANNPLINNLVTYKADTKQSALHLTLTIPPQISQSGYDLVLAPHPMYNPDKWNSVKHPKFGDNLIYAWVRALEEHKIPYTLPLETSLRLSQPEISRVVKFREKVKDFDRSRNILMEVHGESGQTFWDHTWTIVAGKYLLKHKYTNLFISRRHNSGDIQELSQSAPGRVYFVGDLSIRECAELFNHCDAFFSVSSGLSNACNTNWCKNDIKWVETINSPAVTSAPIRKEGKVFWTHNDKKEFLKMLGEEGL
jgi:hypothetical protein